MSPMFLMIEKIISPLDIPHEAKMDLVCCLDLAYAIGAGDMATDPKMPSKALQIFDEIMELIKNLKLLEEQ